jgi:hypothetical protein
MAYKLTWKNSYSGEEIVACEHHVTNNINAMLEMYEDVPSEDIRPDLWEHGYPNAQGILWDLHYEFIDDDK